MLIRRFMHVNVLILINSNYSSFIQRPFKVMYSGALPAQPRSKNVVLRPERKRTEWATGVRRSATGRPFQAVGPGKEKARRCRKTVRERDLVTPPAQKSAMRYDAQ